MIVGFSKSGKSILAKKIARNFRKKITRIDANLIHDFLNQTYPIFMDDNTIAGSGFEIRQNTTYAIRESMIDVLLANGHSVLLDSCNLSKEKRKDRLVKAKKANPKVITMIIYNKISQSELYKNLKKADRRNIKNNEEPAWVDLYEKIQKPNFEKPTGKESNYFMTYDRTNYDKVKRRIGRIFSEIEK